jgi:hypothetical protein
MLNREKLKKRCIASERRWDFVTLHDGEQVKLRSITQRELREWRQSWKKKDGTVDARKFAYSDEALLALCIVDEEDKPVFTLDDAFKGIFDDWDTQDTGLLIEAASKLCRLTRDSVDEDVESAIKNSQETPGNSSSPDSPGKTD